MSRQSPWRKVRRSADFRRQVTEARPSELVIGEPALHGNRLTAEVRFGGNRWDAWYATDDAEPVVTAAPFVTAFLLAAMRTSSSLRVDGPVPAELLRNLDDVQGLVSAWDARYRRIPVTAPAIDETVERATGEASFFSAGLDSCYTAVKHADTLDALIFVHGFDVPLDSAALRATVRDGVLASAKSVGKPLVEVETNIRRMLETVAPWTAMHGGVIAGVGHVLSTRFSRFLVPSTFRYSMLQPHGTHPMLDPLWGSENVSFRHDGAECHRPEKAQVLATQPEVLRWLRVCWRNTSGRYNCGRCVKCLNTLSAFEFAGALAGLESFPARRRPALIPAELTWRKIRSSEERNPAFGPRSVGVNDPDWGSTGHGGP